MQGATGSLIAMEKAEMEEDAEDDDPKEDERNGLPLTSTQDSVQLAGRRTREKSLGQLCQQFITLFITWSRVLSLEQAASKLAPAASVDDHTLKTRVCSHFH